MDRFLSPAQQRRRGLIGAVAQWRRLLRSLNLALTTGHLRASRLEQRSSMDLELSLPGLPIALL